MRSFREGRVLRGGPFFLAVSKYSSFFFRQYLNYLRCDSSKILGIAKYRGVGKYSYTRIFSQTVLFSFFEHARAGNCKCWRFFFQIGVYNKRLRRRWSRNFSRDRCLFVKVVFATLEHCNLQIPHAFALRATQSR